MSSIFQDGFDVYADSTWESGPWRNYIRKPKAKRLTFATDDVDMDFFCVEEDLVGYKLFIRGRTSIIDIFTHCRLFDSGDNQLSESTDGMEFETDPTEANYAQLPVFEKDISANPVAGYNWVLPGLGFRVAESAHETSLFTAIRDLTYTVRADDLSPKDFDGGIHSWIKLDTAGVGIANAFYSKPIPAEFLQGENSLLVFNGLGNKHTYNTILNRALTLHLMGSLDGINYDTLGEILADVDICHVDGMSETLQYTYMLSGVNYPKYNYYKFRWYVEDGEHVEATANKQNFILLSLYKTSR
jgi:hypothetical protein